MKSWALDRYYIWRIMSVIIAVMLMQLPLPYSLAIWQPQWALLVLLFWIWASPYCFNVFWVIVLGLVTDYLAGLPLGVFTSSFVVLSLYIRCSHNKLQQFRLNQQLFFSIVLFIVNLMILRLSFWLCDLPWVWHVMLFQQMSTLIVWGIILILFDFHKFWFAHVG